MNRHIRSALGHFTFDLGGEEALAPDLHEGTLVSVARGGHGCDLDCDLGVGGADEGGHALGLSQRKLGAPRGDYDAVREWAHRRARTTRGVRPRRHDPAWMPTSDGSFRW